MRLYLFLFFIFAIILMYLYVKHSKTERPIHTQNCEPNFVGQIANPLNCAQYFLCFNGFEIEQTCPDNHSYNVEQQQCVMHSLNDCTGRPYIKF
ncbi:ChtB2 [Ectropis obliqua nucleopolyhedrovirus]|uniref:ChtB2 n=1 Tax=Ectropis obliqua nucleopolyhedrovirus TaxID=59376 RepID=A0EYV6_9ABAC|nr:ChtB2 [Ectropis obliqua nucleopolyhedrovirus]ABI35736.1 ChtB2 [Ectropis obliqua nucleopolyhedrovirus]QWV59678.1 ChtB2 [Ectropis obliqua nucleopolyhedrovirus]UYO72851.1 ChtB2 [Ectropis obliqua nucleopolyhedrovirus]